MSVISTGATIAAVMLVTALAASAATNLRRRRIAAQGWGWSLWLWLLEGVFLFALYAVVFVVLSTPLWLWAALS